MATQLRDPFNVSGYLVDRHVEAGDGGREAVRVPGEALDYAQLADRVARVAAALRGAGVRPEERVVLLMPDGVELLTGILGAMRMGAVAVPVSTMLTGTELATLVSDSRARTLVASRALGEIAGVAAAGSPELTELIVHGGGQQPDVRPDVTVVDWDEFLAGGDGQAVEAYPTWADSPALWLYTSGTTGTPKAAMHRHGSIRDVVETYGTQVLGIRPDDRCLSVAKLFFAYGIGNSAFFPLGVGATTVLEPARPTPASIAERVASERPTLFFGVPTFYSALLASDVPDDTFDSVRQGVSAGEPLPASLFTRVRDRFGFEVLDGIGSTEALHIFVSNRPGQVRPGSSGTPVPGYEVQLRDSDGGLLGQGETGALFVRGPSIATGYWCRTDVTRATFQGEWLRTGDTYLRNEDGTYSYLGRSDDMIKAGGMWVSPAEVEARLLEHPSVAEAAVVAVPDESGLDKPVACVVAAPGATIDAGELDAFCREGLAAFKRPRQVVEVAELPKTATGKIRRFELRDSMSRSADVEPAEPVTGGALA
ncbi:MAG: benzoate-CoA ligase family protein [Pseudonocardiaceae bacterium]|nr:benzoate-CoA ligase family protein [Pseudonocardiaceae bacterium]